MGQRQILNQEINVTSLYFLNRQPMRSLPRRIEFAGRAYNFLESGLEYQIKHGDQVVSLFDMSDGSTSYRIKFDSLKAKWFLISMTTA